MKILVINGQSHKGSTYAIAHMLADKLDGDITEFFLPKDFDEFCMGCTSCFMKGEENCPHYEKLEPFVTAIDEADVIIFASPVYVMHVTGSMKAFLDHLGYRWMSHRPRGCMFKKQAVCISTAAGSGTKSTNKDMADSAFYLGCAKIYSLGFNVQATSWETVKPERKNKIDKKTDKLAAKIKRRVGLAKPGFKTKFMFGIMRALQKKGMMVPVDREYWDEKGWLDKARPWK